MREKREREREKDGQEGRGTGAHAHTYIGKGHGSGLGQLLLVANHVVLVVRHLGRGQRGRLHKVQVVVT